MIQTLPLCSVDVVKLGCLFHPVVEAGRWLPGKGKAPPTKGSVPPSLPLASPGRAGRSATFSVVRGLWLSKTQNKTLSAAVRCVRLHGCSHFSLKSGFLMVNVYQAPKPWESRGAAPVCQHTAQPPLLWVLNRRKA